MTIEGIVRGQSGVISRAQAFGAGMSRSMISRRVAARSFLCLHPAVYLVAGHQLSPDLPTTVDLTVPQRWKRSTQRGIRVRRRDLPPTDRVESGGIWVTSAPLAVLEAAAELGEAGVRLLDRALQRRITLEGLQQAHSRNLGRHGAARSAHLLRVASDRTASEAERLAVSLLREAGIDGWECGYRIGAYEADIAFPGKALVIEIDGWAWHSDAPRFQRDRRRQNALVLAGWRVLRFTWWDLTARPDAVVQEVWRAVGDHRSGRWGSNIEPERPETAIT